MQNELINLNARKKTFEIEGEVQGQTVKGSFTVHFPSIMDQINIETKLASILTGVDLNNMLLDAYNVARAVCYLETVVDKKPEWFDMNVLDNDEIILKVYQKAKEFEASFRQNLKSAGSKEASKPREDEETLESE